jgi:hypothetical protein
MGYRDLLIDVIGGAFRRGNSGQARERDQTQDAIQRYALSP